MQTNLLKTVAAALLFGAAGCYSLEKASLAEAAGEGLRLHAGGGEPVSHIVVANDGWYLLNCWPLATGNTNEMSWLPFHFFCDDVKEDVLHNRLTKHAQSNGCDIADLVVLRNEQVLLSVPGFSIPLPLPCLATYRRLQFSAVLVKHAEVSTAESDAARRRAMSREMKLLLNEIPNGGNE